MVFYSLDEAFGFESLDLPDAFHPQTLLAYGMNGQDLPTRHGAPVRLRVARQLGYKSIKFLSRMTVTDTLKNIGSRPWLHGSGNRLFLVRGHLMKCR